MTNYAQHSHRLPTRPQSAWILLITAALLTISACSDDVQSDQCPAGEQHNPIQNICTPIVCQNGMQFNPITNQCSGRPDPFDTGDDLDASTNPTNDSGNPTNPINDSGNPTNDSGNPINDSGTTNPPDPNNPNTPDPGTPGSPYQPQNPATAQYHSCTSADTRALTPPKFIINHDGNYLLATEHSLNNARVNPTVGNLAAHVFEDPQNKLTGFIATLATTSAQTTPTLLSQNLLTTVKTIAGMNTATQLNAGRQIQTHDQMSAIASATILLPAGTAPHIARDQILARLVGLSPDQLPHTLTTNFPADPSAPTLLTYEILRRNHTQYVIVVTLTTQPNFNNTALKTSMHIGDLTSGTALAFADETMTDQCLSYTIRDTNEVDIIISLDKSGSMDAVNAAIANFSQEFTQLLNAAGVDWRIGITGVDCSNIQTDTGLSQEYRNMWPAPTQGGGGIFDTIQTPCKEPFGGGGNNGKLIGGNFSRDAAEIKTRLGRVSTTGDEYTFTMGVAAIDRSLPRADNAPNKIRTNAAVILVVVTDENEQLFKDKLSFVSGSGQTLTPPQRTQLENFTAPWVEYLHRTDIDAPVFGLYWVPGEACTGATDVAHGIHHIVQQTGGKGGSICQPDITNTFRDVVDATRDLTSGLRLVGPTVAASIQVLKEGPNNANSRLNRSTTDGFNFDATNNSVVFHGPTAPQVDERIVVPYLRWNRSVIPCDSTEQCTNGAKCSAGICR